MKLIAVTPEMLEKAWEEQKAKLLNQTTGLKDTSITIKLNPDTLEKPKDEAKPHIKMTATAFYKMRELVCSTNKEIAWHGLVERHQDNQFLIYDILVYPQIVSGATVTTDDDKYSMWNCNLTDEQVPQLRFQGHSHVDFGVGPSAVDLDYYNDLLKLVPKDDFYIFAIINKRNQQTWFLYNMKTNLIYEEKDLDISVVDDAGSNLDDWVLEQIDEHIEEHTVKMPYNYNGGKTGAQQPLAGFYGIGKGYEDDDRDVPLYTTSGGNMPPRAKPGRKGKAK